MVSTMGTASAADTFAIHGELNDLYPGFDGTLQARVVNTLDVPIRVQQVSAAPTAVDGAGCDRSMLIITSSDLALDLEPGEAALVPLHARMSADAPDACQNVVFGVDVPGTSLAEDRSAGSLAYTGNRTDVLVVAGLTILLVGTAFARRARSRHLP